MTAFDFWKEDIPTFVDVCHRLYAAGFVCAYDGNVSLRRGDEILVTPTHLCKGEIGAEDLLIVDRSGALLHGQQPAGRQAGRPSSELRLHLAVYDRDPAACCIIHAHPLYATALYREGRTIDTSLLTEAADTLGTVPLVPYAPPGSQALADAVGTAMAPANVRACVMERHGTVTSGSSLMEAYYLLESLERLARTAYLVGTMK